MAQTTFARIATRGGLSSTRLISYHFDSKTALMEATVAHVYRSIDEFLAARVSDDPASRPIQPIGTIAPPSGTSSASDELRAYIVGAALYIDTHREDMRALQSIFAASHAASYDPGALQADPEGGPMRHLEAILRRGIEQREFRDLDPLVIAAMIQRPIEALPQLLANRPEIDPHRYATELADAVDHATRLSGI